MKHNIAELKERFYSLLEKLDRDYNFSDNFYDCGGSAEEFLWMWEEQEDACDDLHIWTANGATKIVIGTYDFDYIIKFQLSDSFDYCAREVETYNAAEASGLEDKFAWCDKLFDFTFSCQGNEKTVPVYVMEWCKCDYDTISDVSYEYHYHKYISSHALEDCIESRNKFYNSDEYDDDGKSVLEWACDIWGTPYGEASSAEILTFLRDMRINDLHAGNWGWCNNRLVLTDYSGYGEDLFSRNIDY